SVIRSLLVLSMSVGLMSLTTGCSPDGLKLIKAGGQVTYKGKPLGGANVKFIPGSGPVAIAITDDEGNFTITTNGRSGATLGTHKVAISKISGATIAVASPKPEDMMKMAKDNMGKANTGPKNEIPEKYSDPENSKLTAEVSANASDNEFLFQLQ
ncbi:MAG: hypothetical protein ABI557_12860, partial [Aureliella sp.]